MYRMVGPAASNLPDAVEFIQLLNTLDQSEVAEARGLFDAGRELIVARAPGRLDVMGGIADYSGSLVLQLPIKEATLVALQRDASRSLTVVSLSLEAARASSLQMSLSEFEEHGGPATYTSVRARFESDQGRHWASYVAGVFLVLMRERNLVFREGARVLVWSRVPEGRGVSSSAALEVASMQAVCAAFGISLEPTEVALLCQKVENLVVGAPCGVMDQMTAACGEANRLLALVCQPAELRQSIPIPEHIAFWGIDSGVRHAVTGEDYRSVRVGAFMGYRIIAELAGLKVAKSSRGETAVMDDPRWHGCLANVSPSEFEQVHTKIPERMNGGVFLDRYGGITDTVTHVVEDRRYLVRAPTAHAVLENDRIHRFAELISEPADERRLELIGELMYSSHASYSACGLGCAQTDRLVELVRDSGPRTGLYGARITGGGSGGTVAVLGRPGAAEAIDEVSKLYASETGYQPRVFSGSSPGSSAFGHLRLCWA